MRTAGPIALVAMLLLSGCLGAKQEIAPNSLLSGALGAANGLVGGQYTFPASATEPSIGADAKGAVYMTGFSVTGEAGGIRPHPTVWATFDHGASFHDVGPSLPTGDGRHVNTNDPILFVDYSTGRVFDDDILPLSCGFLSWSDDQGKTWTTNPYSCGNNNVNDHQTVAASKARSHPTVGYPNVVYRCVNNLAMSECAMSFTGGLTFTPQLPVFVSPRDGCAGLTGHLVPGPDGKMYLPKADCPGGPLVKVTADDGVTWTDIKIPSKDRAGNHDMGFQVDANGAMYALWETKAGIVFTSSADGKTWLEPRVVTHPDVTATMFNAMALGAPGKIAFAYLGSTVPGGYAGKCQGNAGLAGNVLGQPNCPEWANATWNAYIGVITDALTPNATVTTTTANDPSDPLARGLCGGTRCHGMNDFIDISIDAEGRPWASFVDTCTQKCVTDPNVLSDVSLGTMATLREGPSLRANGTGVLLSVLAPAAPSGGGTARAAPAQAEPLALPSLLRRS